MVTVQAFYDLLTTITAAFVGIAIIIMLYGEYIRLRSSKSNK